MSSEASEDDQLHKTQSWVSRAVFAATCLLVIISIFGSAAAVSIYIFQAGSTGVNACQIILIVACSISFIFVGVYVLAARRNEAVGLTRPPPRPWHNACFVMLRTGLICWATSIISTLVIALKGTCNESEFLCLMQKLEAGLSIAAFIMTALLLTMLEMCDRPFDTPQMLRIRPKITRRTSSFDDDLMLERSVSRRSSFDDAKKPQYDQLYVEKRPTSPSPPTPMYYPQPGHSSTPLPGQDDGDRLPSWGSGWNYLESEPASTPKASLPEPAQSMFDSFTPSDVFVGQRPQRAASKTGPSNVGDSAGSEAVHTASKAAPSSSISDSSHRSPLSVMRTVDYPEVPIEPDLRFNPVPGVHATPEVNGHRRRKSSALQRPARAILGSRGPLSAPNSRQHIPEQPRSSSLPSSRPPNRTAYMQYSQSYQGPVMPPQLTHSQPQQRPHHPPAPPPPPPAPRIVRRKTADCRVPGAFHAHAAPATQADALDLHTRLIEDAILVSAQKVELSRVKTPPPPPRSIGVPSTRAFVPAPHGHSRVDSAVDLRETRASGEPYVRDAGDKRPSMPEMGVGGRKRWEV